MRFPVIRLLDLLLKPYFVTPSKIADEKLFHRIREDAEANTEYLVKSVLYDMSIIDTKSTALLTHISVIIAALIFSLSLFQEDSILRFFVSMEIVAYFVVALVNLRCLYIMGPPHRGQFKDAKAYEEELVNECLMRRTIYFYCLRLIFIFTAIIPLVALFKIFIDVGI